MVFLVLSSLVVCSLLSAVFVGLSFSDVLPNLFDKSTEVHTVMPGSGNSDVINEQQTVVASDPENVEELLLLANLLSNSERLQDAIPVFEHALEMSPDDVNARVTFARALVGGGLTSDAEFQYKKALEIAPNDQQANYYLAELYMSLEPPDKAKAIEHYQRAYAADTTTLIGERSKTQLEALGASIGSASPLASPEGTPLPVEYGPASPSAGN